MKRTLNTPISRSKNKKNDEFYTQYTLIFSLCGAAPLRETTPSYDIDGNRISGDLHGDQRRMGGGYDLSQCKGALKGTMGRCEFTDKSLALSRFLFLGNEQLHHFIN